MACGIANMRDTGIPVAKLIQNATTGAFSNEQDIFVTHVHPLFVVGGMCTHPWGMCCLENELGIRDGIL